MKEQQDFKKKVVAWLNENGLFPKIVKVFNTRRYGFEVRVYCPSMNYLSNRCSSRMIKGTKEKTEKGFTWQRTYGKHDITIPMYIHITEHEFVTEDEREIILEMVKHDAILSSPN